MVGYWAESCSCSFIFWASYVLPTLWRSAWCRSFAANAIFVLTGHWCDWEGFCKFWLGQWKHPRYRIAGIIHILIFAGFIVLVMRAFSVLILGVSENFVMPGLSGRAGHIYDIVTDYAATVVFLCMVIAAIRRLVFKPARYAVPAQVRQSATLPTPSSCWR